MSIKNKNGFTVVEALLIILILVVIGFAGYYVWHTQSNKSTTTQQAAESSANNSASSGSALSGPTVSLKTDSAVLEKFQLPSTWQVVDRTTHVDISVPGNTSCSYTVTNNLEPIESGTATPKSLANNPNNSILLEYDIVKQPDTKSLADYFVDDLYMGDGGDRHTVSNYAVNGNPAYLYKAIGSGQYVYEDDYYLISHGGYVACFRWRPIDKTSDPGYDNSKYSSDVKNITGSTKFTN